jgi:ABC-type nickel/cobalt efflux system permease component RcnA
MLILEIAAGIVLGVVVLIFWRVVLALALLAVALFVVLLIAGAVWSSHTAMSVLGVLLIAWFVLWFIRAVLRDWEPTRALWRKRREAWRERHHSPERTK